MTSPKAYHTTLKIGILYEGLHVAFSRDRTTDAYIEENPRCPGTSFVSKNHTNLQYNHPNSMREQ